MAPKGAIRLFGLLKTQKMKNVKSAQQAHRNEPSYLKEVLAETRESAAWFGLNVRAHTRRQFADAFGPAQRAGAQYIVASLCGLREAWRARNLPARRETFEEAVVRLGLGPTQLAAKELAFRRLHWLNYALGYVVALYGVWLLGGTTAAWSGFYAELCAAALLIRGYLWGFRAWQVRNRRLISLPAALRTPSTYLVI